MGKCHICKTEISEGYTKVTLEKSSTIIHDKIYCMKCLLKDRIRELLKKSGDNIQQIIYFEKVEIEELILEVLKEKK